jgi:hypothetical protein
MKYIFLIACVIMMIGLSSAQVEKSESPFMKTGYIPIFIKYTEWQNEQDIDVFRIGILGNSLVTELMNDYFKKYPIKNYKPVDILFFNSADEVTDIHFLFVADDWAGNIDEVYDKIQGKNTLLVTDNCRKKDLIMINFDEHTSDKQLEINLDNIAKEGLKMSSKLVSFNGVKLYSDN